MTLWSSYSTGEDPLIYIKINEAKSMKNLMAITPLQFLGTPTPSSKFQEIGSELFNVIKQDLDVSSYFEIMPQKSYLQDTSKVPLKPNFSDETDKTSFFSSWKTLKTDFLIRAAFTRAGDDLTLEAYVYHVPKSILVFGKKYQSTVKGVRRLAHTFCNDVLENLTGQKGMFLSKIAVSSDRDGGNSKEIYTMDWDGANPFKVSNYKSLAISPAWSNNGKKLAFTAYVKRSRSKMRNADLLLYDFDTGKTRLTSFRPGINSGASFSPDDQYIYLTLSESGSPDIFKMTLDGVLTKKLTTGPNQAINVEPAVSPDGKFIAFSSDRHGRPMIYIMSQDGDKSYLKRITQHGTFNSTPVWSPDGKKLAFSAQNEDRDGHFDIFVVDINDTSKIVRITSALKKNGKPAKNEDPSFSPDGRFIMYTSNRTGFNQIYISTVDGKEERWVTNDEFNYYKPKWSKNFE